MNDKNTFETIFILYQIIWYNILGLYSLYRGSFLNNGSYKSAAIHGIVCFINSFCCIMQYINLDLLFINEIRIKYLRYIEWTVCTPLMILEIALSSNLTSIQTMPIIVLSISFCLCGTIAAMTTIMWFKIVLGVQGTLYCIIVIYRLWKLTLEKIDFATKDTRVAIANLLCATTIWPVFVVTWGLGPDVYQVINIKHEYIIDSVSSITLKTFALSFALISTSERIEKTIEFITGFIR